MKALTYDRFGGIDALHFADRPTPDPKPGEVLVALRATSLNLIDARVRRGMMGPLVNKRFPKIPGADIAGVVAAIGPGVPDLAVGQPVFGAANPFTGGALSDYVAVPASQLAPKPEGLSFDEAASLPIAGLAALIALRDLGQTRAGTRVLIHGASGPVGLYAVQIAKSLGAHVTAVAGTAGVAQVRAFGADRVIDYRREDGQRFAETFDVILNASGALPWRKARAFLAPAGRMVEPSPTIPAFIGSKLANLFRRQQHLMLQTMPTRQGLADLTALVAEGKLSPTIARRYSFAEAKAAFAELEAGGVVGKLVVAMA